MQPNTPNIAPSAEPHSPKSPAPLSQFNVIREEPPPEFLKQIIDRFGSRYEDIVKKYGAVEYAIDPDTYEILDIYPPEEYLAESDQLATERFHSGARDSERCSITAGALSRIAAAEAQFYAVQYDQLKSEPSFMREYIEELAVHRPELIPDIQGFAPELTTLLHKPRFVGQLCRYSIHNLLVHLGKWHAISKYLLDVQHLDDTEGRLGAPARRKELMGYVKRMLTTELLSLEKRVRHAIYFHTPVKDIWIRRKDHPDFGGAVLSHHPDKPREFAAGFVEKSVYGAFVRFMAPALCKETMKWTSEDCRNELFIYLDADPLAWQALDPYLSEQLTQLRRLMDFEEMLDHPEEVSMTDEDPLFTEFADAITKSQDTFGRINLEKHIKSIESLEKPNISRKIWRDVEVHFDRKHGLDPRSFIGYEQAAPSWNVEVVQSPERSSSPTPAAIRPYREVGNVAPPIIEEPTADRGPKIKTRPQNTEPDEISEILCGSMSISADVHQDAILVTFPVFLLSKSAFEVFDKIFTPGRKGHMDFTDFANAMLEVGFSYDPKRSGSRATFHPNPAHSNKSLCCHK
ncbi:hypothetical protein ONZ45_g2411 [Pleurotus djamor]|nr:hypothetical protein ONZ45_g2411 [Pleurotus djamor]